jgi:CHAT domain-containing protein/Tfp pilus assembly protein PilF
VLSERSRHFISVPKCVFAGSKHASRHGPGPDDRIRRSLCALAYHVIFLGTLQLAMPAQDIPRPGRLYPSTASIVVEKVSSGSTAASAGLRSGDVLLRWAAANERGEITSPFDPPILELEWAPRGPVRIQGLRGEKRREWVLRGAGWGFTTRPEMPRRVLFQCREILNLAERGYLSTSVQRWELVRQNVQESLPVWFGPWLIARAASLSQSRPIPDWETIDAAYMEAISESIEAGREVRIALLDRWADSFQDRDDLVNAERYYNDELTEEKSLDPKSIVVASTLTDLGIVGIKKGDFVEAEAHLREALVIEQELAPRDPRMATIFGNLAVLAHDQGDFASAEAYYRKAIASAESSPDLAGTLAINLVDLGDLVRRRGDLPKAFRYERRALRLAQRADPRGTQVGTILSFLGQLAVDQGDIALATDYQRRALVIRRRESPRSLSVALSLVSLGNIAQIRGELAKAEDLYSQALAIAEQLPSPPLELSSFLNSLGELAIKQQNWDKAETLYRRSISIAEERVPAWDQFDAQVGLAKITRHKEQWESSAVAYRRALDILESQTARLGGSDNARAGFRARHSNFYREYVSFLVEQKQIDLALEVLEGGRARTLLELLISANADIRRGIDPTLLARENSLRKLLNGKLQYRFRLLSTDYTDQKRSALDKEVVDLTESYHQLEAEIRATSPAYAALTQPRKLSVQEIQRSLDPGTLLLEYSLDKEHSYVWAVTENALEVHRLSSRREIERTAVELYRALTARTWDAPPGAKTTTARTKADADYGRAAAKLSRLILAPVATLFPGKRLVIVGDGALQYIPFSALPAPVKGELPLALEHEIVNLPSASVLAEIREAAEGRSSAGKAVAILADPVFDATDGRVSKEYSADVSPGGSISLSSSTERLSRSASDFGLLRGGRLHFGRLPYTRQESQVIASIAGRSRAMQALDFSASRATAMSPELAHYRIVHFATHGLVDSKRPEFSGLVLSLVNDHGRPEDGFLSLEDIYNLKLPVDLVVLSGCETGLGEEISGEGLIGLTRGFMYAGARRVVASLWTVDDLATSELMARFYRAMERDKMRPAAALRKAQVEMFSQKAWRSPYHWAAFQIQGDWR